MPGKTRFRPRVESLEGREVPAAFSFQLPDGTIGSGQFATPEGVDPNQSSQSLGLGGLTTVTIGTDTYTINDYATGQYANGVLVGVTGAASGAGGTLELNGASVTLGTDSAAMALDGSDTAVSFTLSDGTVGSISFAIPWDSVDETLASQSVAPANFTLNIAGHNYTEANANFTGSPALQFAYGEYVALSFAVSITDPSAPYTAFAASVSQGSSSVVATKAGVGQLAPAAINVKKPLVVLNFNIGANDTKDTVIATGTVIRIHIVSKTYGVDTFVYDYNEPTLAGETVGNIAEQIYENMKTAGWNVARTGDGKGVIVNGKWIFLRAGLPEVTLDVAEAGINYSGTSQPRGPKFVGVQQLILEQGVWKPKAKQE